MQDNYTGDKVEELRRVSNERAEYYRQQRYQIEDQAQEFGVVKNENIKEIGSYR
jgi:hypothetical protein